MKTVLLISLKRILFVVGCLTLITSLFSTPVVIAQDSSEPGIAATVDPNAEITAGSTIFLPCITKEYCPGAAPSPFSVQIAGLSDLNTTGLNSVEAEQLKALRLAEFNDAFPTMVNAIKESGAGWARVYIDWSYVQPTESGPYNWSNYDNWLGQVASAGVQIIATVSNPPTWAAPSKDLSTDCSNLITKLPEFNTFLTALVNRYKQSQYDIHTWEILNEPDAIDGYRCASGVSNYGHHGADYATLVQGASSAIKLADPTAKVIMGGIAYDWFYLDVDVDPYQDGSREGKFNRYFTDDIMTAGAADSLDAVNFHFFRDFSAEWERWTVGSDGLPTCGNIRTLNGTTYMPYGLDLVAKGSHFLGRLSTCFNVNKPLWVTEVGMHGIDGTSSYVTVDSTDFNQDLKDRYDAGQTLENQGRYVFKVYARGLSLGAENITWYAIKIIPSVTPGDFQGLLYDSRDPLKDNQPKPAFYAFQILTRELNGYAFSQTLFGGASPDHVEAYEFTHACQGTKTIAWTNTTSPTLFVVNSVSSVRLVYRPSADGTPDIRSIADGGTGDGDLVANGSITINLGIEPVIIQPIP